MGMEKLSIYKCLFTNNGSILVIYIYDPILIYPSKQNINGKITSLMKDYDLNEEGQLRPTSGTVLNATNMVQYS